MSRRRAGQRARVDRRADQGAFGRADPRERGGMNDGDVHDRRRREHARRGDGGAGFGVLRRRHGDH